MGSSLSSITSATLSKSPEVLSSKSENNSAIFTENGAKSYSMDANPLLELFYRSVRDIDCTDWKSTPHYATQNEKKRSSGPSGEDSSYFDDSEGTQESQGPSKRVSKKFEDLFDAAYAYDKKRTIRFVFYLRDCRGGKGEKKLFRSLVRHLRSTGREDILKANLENFPFYGTWKDLLDVFLNTPLEAEAIQTFARQLLLDEKQERPSICAKYAPRQNSTYDRKHVDGTHLKAATKLATALHMSLPEYRKTIAKLSRKIEVVEQLMCANQWSDIQYPHVPSIAMDNYKKAFKKHDAERYQAFLEKVIKGEAKMNTSVLMPHQIVGGYSRHGGVNTATEAQWTSFIADRKTKIPADFNVLPIVDVSGSMGSLGYGDATSPINVAVAMGVMFSQLSTGFFEKTWCTFSSKPTLEKLQGDTLFDICTNMSRAKWGMNTDLIAVFSVLLENAKSKEIPPEQMPKALLILSDMQFDQACSNNDQSNWEKIESMYAESSYTRPVIIFWNLAGNTRDFPVPSDKVKNCMCLSGYSDTILYSLMDLKVPTPAEIVLKALDNPRYDRVVIP